MDRRTGRVVAVALAGTALLGVLGRCCCLPGADAGTGTTATVEPERG